jgi:type II secretory pathway component PulJ
MTARTACHTDVRVAGARRPRRGAGLVEIMLAMIIFALIATSYAAVTLRYATRMKTISAGAARSAALTEYLNRLMAVPYDSLPARAGTFVTTTGAFPNTRTITVATGAASNSKLVTLILTPTNTIIKPDTVVLTRVKRVTNSPLGP